MLFRMGTLLRMETPLAIDLSSFLLKKKGPLVGLDISTSGIKLVELSDCGGGMLRLDRYASEVLPVGAISDGNIDNIEQVAEAVRRVWKKSGTRSKNVVLGMPAASVITRTLVLDSELSEDAMELQVENDASQYIPFSLDEVSMDFAVIGPAPNSPTDVEVLLAASRKEKVEDRVAVAESAGLKPKIMDIEAHAAQAAIERVMRLESPEESGRIVALIQIGAQVMHITVLKDNERIYDREQPFGGNQLTQSISRAYGLSIDEAEARKRTGDLPENYQEEILLPFLDVAAMEVSRAIQFFFTSTPHTNLDKIYLAGGCACIPKLVETVVTRTRTSAAVVMPFHGMELGSGIREKHLRAEAPGFLVACGLALRRFD